MNDIIYNYIIQGVLGAASGYITNDYAINMLFKEYTPLKIGGVIKKTRNEFIDNISSLVENDIINKEKLNSILSDDAFISKFEELTEDFYKNCLYEVAGSDLLSNINGMDSSVETTRNFLDSILEKHLNEITGLLFHNIKTDNFLTETQLDKISNSLFETLRDNMRNTDTINDLLLSLYSEKSNINFSDILGEKKDKTIDITNNILSKLDEIIKRDSNIDDSIMDIIESIGFDKAFSSVKNLYFEKSLKDIIKIDDEFNKKAVQLFINYINSEKGQNIINDLCESLFSYLKKIDKTVFEIIDSSFEINLKSYLLENLPNLTENIIAWVNLNSKNIDKLIEDSIDEVIKESDGMKGKLLNTIKNSYLNNLSEKYNIVQKIIEFIEKETEPKKLSNNLSSRIIDYLSNYSIRNILIALENNKILIKEKTVNYITEYFNNNFQAVFNEASNHIKNIKIKDIMPVNISMEIIIKEKLFQIIKDNILSSNKINTALSEKINYFVRKYSDKSINEIIPKECLQEKIPHIKDFILNSIDNNSDSIKDLIKNEIKINSNKIDVNNSINIKDIISTEIIKKYDNFTDNFKNKKLTLAIDKINTINNLYKNSSESLRTLIINNLDNILSGSIKAIVYENLNKLNDDELCDFANDFIGKELQPIMYFGGILGLSAGLLLALVQNAPPDMGAITLANMATYSFVGYLTNVIAINMIFKPYKEVKFLRKIPFLKNFSIGYIVKNKNIFAESTAHFVDNNLLSKESINEIFEKYEDSIKNSFNSSLVANDYFILHKLLTNNHESIVSSSYEFSKNLIDKNTESLCNFAFEGMGKIKLSSLLSPASINYLSNLGEINIKNANNKINDFIISKAHSTISLENQISNSLVKSAENTIQNIVDKYYNITSENLGDIEYLKRFLMTYSEKYISFTNKKAAEILNHNQIASFNKFISKSITNMLLSIDTRQKAFELIVNLFNKSFDRNKTFGELFNGKFKEYFDNNIPSIFDKISGAIKNNIVKSKGIVSISVQAEIVNNLGFLEKGMYNLFGGKDIVDELIHKIMVVKVPQFIDEKNHELLKVFSYTIVESFYNLKVENLHNSLNKLQINDMVDSYFSNDENVDFIKDKVILTTNSMVSKIVNVNISDILKVISLDNINNIFNNYKDEISELSKNLSSNMIDNKDMVINKIFVLINKIIDEFMISTSFNDLCHEISFDDINVIINNIEDVLIKDDFIKNSIENLLSSYKEFMIESSLSEFIDKDELVNSTETYIKTVLISDETEAVVKNIFSSILIESTDSNFNFIHEETKSYFANIFVESSVKSIRRNLDTMLKTIEFDRIAREEIEAMEPRKIHEMFNSFAGKYFKKLMLYGFGGFVFGINMYIGLSLTGLKIIKEKFSKN